MGMARWTLHQLWQLHMDFMFGHSYCIKNERKNPICLGKNNFICARQIFLQLWQLQMELLFKVLRFSTYIKKNKNIDLFCSEKLSKENNFICARRIFLQLWQLQMELLFRGNQAEITLLPLPLPLVAAFLVFPRNVFIKYLFLIFHWIFGTNIR